jgi:TatD DNase family protein
MIHPKLEYISQEQQQIQEQYANERIQELYDLCIDGIQDHTVVAYGECGLDYDRLEFCSKPIQQYYFQQQLLHIALPLNLPLFLHNRNVQDELYITLRNIRQQYQALPSTVKSRSDCSKTDIVVEDVKNDDTGTNEISSLSLQKLQQWDGNYRGVVHSFDDTIELALLFIHQLQLYIGINGCSLRTEQNIQTVQQLPLTSILLETEYVVILSCFTETIL